jgi:hypothetical protein
MNIRRKVWITSILAGLLGWSSAMAQASKSVKFEVDIVDGKLLGYKYAQAGMEALAANDSVALFMKGPMSPMPPVKTVAIQSVKREKNRLLWELKEPVKVTEKETTKKLSFLLKDGWYRLE